MSSVTVLTSGPFSDWSDLEVPEEPAENDDDDDASILDVSNYCAAKEATSAVEGPVADPTGQGATCKWMAISTKRASNDIVAEFESDGGMSSASSVLGFVTAVKIARWMARAYGYVAKKKSIYVSQDLSCRKNSSSPEGHQGKGSSPIGVVEEENHEIKRLLRMRSQPSFDAKEPTVPSGSVGSGLGHDEAGGVAKAQANRHTYDEDTICRWVARSYGQTNKEYHEAYSREILRQIRNHLILSATALDQGGDGGLGGLTPNTWF